MQALRPGPECRFRVPVQSTDSGPAGCPKKEELCRAHHFESIISRTSFREDRQNSQHVACLPLSLSPCRILSCRDQALLLSWASSGSSGQKASCSLCTRGSFLMDTGENSRKFVGVQACFLLPPVLIARTVRAVCQGCQGSGLLCRTEQSLPAPGPFPGMFFVLFRGLAGKSVPSEKFFAV